MFVIKTVAAMNTMPFPHGNRELMRQQNIIVRHHTHSVSVCEASSSLVQNLCDLDRGSSGVRADDSRRERDRRLATPWGRHEGAMDRDLVPVMPPGERRRLRQEQLVLLFRIPPHYERNIHTGATMSDECGGNGHARLTMMRKRIRPFVEY